MDGDWDSYRDAVALPFHLQTERANLTIADEAALRDGFEDFHEMLRTQQVTDYIRLVRIATFIEDGLIAGNYVTHMLSNAVRVVPPFASQITLRRGDGVWRAVSISNATANTRWPIDLPRVTDWR
ncbi:MAG: hypothetical protein N2422_05765 [Rhodobacteraceae bacterium]|nr:hypothetical protein [Paracoccaceae bacterium]